VLSEATKVRNTYKVECVYSNDTFKPQNVHLYSHRIKGGKGQEQPQVSKDSSSGGLKRILECGRKMIDRRCAKHHSNFDAREILEV
jgi:hypothetical protein